MAPFSTPTFSVGELALAKRYWPAPYSLDPLTPVFRNGLISLGTCAMLSLISVSTLLIFITHRLVSWRKHYKEYVGYNQYVILIYNLLLADLQQSIAFSISFNWLRINKIPAPTAPCFIQAWFLHIGDVSSGFFVLFIAIHTWMGVVRGYRLPYKWFVIAILLTWSLAVVLTLLGPAMHGVHFFARAGGWCWVSTDYQDERLWLHYFWIFIVEFGTIAIYGHIFFHLRGRIRGRSAVNTSAAKLSRATKFMIVYPAVYVVLVLPIAIGRMIAMTGHKLPDAFFCVAGTLLTSCGWVDALVYTLTRRVLVSNQLSSGRHTYTTTITAINDNGTRPGDDYGLRSMRNKETPGTRTVTITGGGNRMSRFVKGEHGLSVREKHGHPDPLGENSLNGSQDSIIVKHMPGQIGIVTETNIQVESATRDSDETPIQIDSRHVSETEYSPTS